jgi:hypothetical protein
MASGHFSIGLSWRLPAGKHRGWSRSSNHFPGAATCPSESNCRRPGDISPKDPDWSIPDENGGPRDPAFQCGAIAPPRARLRCSPRDRARPRGAHHAGPCATGFPARHQEPRKAPPASARVLPRSVHEIPQPHQPPDVLLTAVEPQLNSDCSNLEPNSSDFSPKCELSPSCSAPFHTG